MNRQMLEKATDEGSMPMGRKKLVISLLAVACATSAAAKEGVSRFDGDWSETITGESESCKGSFNTNFAVKDGRIIQPGQNGSVSPDGSASGAVVGNGYTLTWTGHFSATTASGKYKRTDGCIGRWEARKQ
jgi:hypothetical protein